MLIVKLEGGPAASVEPGQKSCVRSSEMKKKKKKEKQMGGPLDQ
jgi:hypothetical protein